MAAETTTYELVQNLISSVKQRDPSEIEFHQAVEEVLLSILPVFEQNKAYLSVMERLLEPDRAVIFRVTWQDDKGKQQVNRGFRVQFNNAIGPYKGGLRFHPSVNLSVVKFLGFEQTFKNALTTLPMGGAKGGSDFNPKGKSDTEIMRFCQSFMTELHKYIGPNTDVPAGDIGVGGREIGYLYGQYKRITARNEGVITGKGVAWGGSKVRSEATGYGLVYIAEEILRRQAKDLKGKRVSISGAGNVAQYAIKKLIDIGAIPITVSDSNGYIYEENGIDLEGWKMIMQIKNERLGRIKEYAEMRPSAVYYEGKRPWEQRCDIAMPCATQNEIDVEDVKRLVEGGCFAVFEGANMPSTNDAISLMNQHHILFAPSKACNAGGVATSGLEMTQNSMRLYWSEVEVEDKLKAIMHSIVDQMDDTCRKYNLVGNYQAGANIAGFLLVADSMIAQGLV